MRIWRFDLGQTTRYAHAGLVGTWASLSPGVCPECGSSQQRRVCPLILEWLPGSDVVGDFVPVGVNDLAITDRVVEVLVGSGVGGFKAGPVEMHVDEDLRSELLSERRGPVVQLPYSGPPLADLWVTACVRVDQTLSSVQLISRCSTCGMERWEVEGAEKRSSRWDPTIEDVVAIHEPRQPNMGIYVEAERLEAPTVFRVQEFSGWIFVTDDVKRLIERERLTNAAFVEMGERTRAATPPR